MTGTRAGAWLLLALVAVGCDDGDAVVAEDPCEEVREAWESVPDKLPNENDREYLRRWLERTMIIVEQNPDCFTVEERAGAEQTARRLERDQ